MYRLPIDDVLPQLLETLKTSKSLVLQAPPGTGKTTRVPLALLDAPWLVGKGVVMLEPRRIAATNAARWMAATLGEAAGDTIGYAIRFDRNVSARTRVEVVTEGILTRRLQADPLLEGIGVVIFDEFHERSIHSDLALALCQDVQSGLRDDLRIIVMSATLDAGPVAKLLGDAPVVTSEGRSYPIHVHYMRQDARDDVSTVACRAVLDAVGQMEGDILVFLPGVGEIRRCQRLLEESFTNSSPLLIAPLYGDLPFAAQEKAILPADRRKVILATNIAETSLTIEGVRVVIDSGFCRRLRFNPATGMNRLVTERVSAASAAQRAGRAGRLGPGTCYRLWTEHVHQTLLAADPPEICTSDLTSLVLDLANWGVGDAGSLSWLDPPPVPALEEGKRLLSGLGALDQQGRITEAGRKMALLPVHPRLAHMLVQALERGYGALACDISAILAERDLFRTVDDTTFRHRSDSDMLDRVEALYDWRAKRSAGDVDHQACRSVDRTALQLRRLAGIGKGEVNMPISADTVGLLLAWAYPDRIALRRDAEGNRFILANGRGGRLSMKSSLLDRPLIVAYGVERGERGDDVIRFASALSSETLMTEFAADICRHRTVGWDVSRGRVSAREEVRFGALVLDSHPVALADHEVQAALLGGIAAGAGLTAFRWTGQATQFRARVRFLARLFPDEGWPDLSDERLLADLESWIGHCLVGMRSLADVSSLDVLSPLQAILTWEQLRRLDEAAPTHLVVPSGSRVILDYGMEGPPTLSVKLQEMFGLAETPTVARGKVSIVVHLLSPAGRPVQVTSNLKGFWNGAYQEVKKEMKGRYPKHPWPDDPWNSMPTKGTKKQQKGK